MPVRTDLQGRSRIYASSPLDAVPQVGELAASGVTRFMVDATLLSPDEVAHEVRRLAAALHDMSKRPEREKGANSGHLFAPIA